ncbi:MAG TPA: hypothetical protein VGF69_07160 [Thermoanaerobaculia bacterium]|jgi:hypothetical protein
MTPLRVLICLLLASASAALAQPRIWFVDNARPNGDGAQATPFNSLASAQSAAAPGDAIYVFRGNAPYRESVALRERQLLAGAGFAVRPLLEARGIAVPEGLPAKGEAPLLDLTGSDPVSVASGAVVAGLSLRTGGTAVRIANVSGVTLEHIAIEKPAGKDKTDAAPCTACTPAIQLTDADDVVLTDVRIAGSTDGGIEGVRVTNLTLTAVEVRNAGDARQEHGILLRDLRGRVVIDRAVVIDSAARQLHVLQNDGEATLEIRRSHFDGGPPPNGAQAILIQAGGEAKLTVFLEESKLTGNFSDGIHLIADERAQLDATVTRNQFAGSAAAVNVIGSKAARLRFHVVENTISGSTATAINLEAGGESSARGEMTNNTIGRSGAAGSGAKCGSCSGISIGSSRSAFVEAVITGNTIQRVDGFGVRTVARGTGEMRLSVARNLIREPDTGALSAISIQSGAGKGDSVDVCADVTGNTITGSWEMQPITVANKLATTTLSLAGYSGDGKDTAAVARHLQARNNKAASTANLNAAAGNSFLPATAACTEK